MLFGKRVTIKIEWIFINFWFNKEDISLCRWFLVMCHGCPSHPYDHAPFGNKRLLQDWYCLVFPNYIGTWWSDGICTFENCIDTIMSVIDFLKTWSLFDNRSGMKYIRKSTLPICLIWASFWGSIALCAGALSNHITKIVACSPIIDWSTHNMDGGEAPLWDIIDYIYNTYNNLWRIDRAFGAAFIKWQLKYISPMEYIDLLSGKDILLIHDLFDPQVKYGRSKDFIESFAASPYLKKIYTLSTNRHILLHHLDEQGIYEEAGGFIA